MAGWSFTGSDLPPDAFAVVIATRIVAIAGYDHGYWRLGIALTVVAVVAFGARFNEHLAAVWLLGGLALVAWLGLVPLALVAAGSTPGVELREQARGGWLLPSVATAGLAITAADLAIACTVWALVAAGWLRYALRRISPTGSSPSRSTTCSSG